MASSKEFNLQEMYKQSLPVQLGVAAAVIVAILGLGYFFVFSDQRAALASAEQAETKLKDDFSKKAKEAAQLPALKKQLEQINESFSVLLRQLPTDAEVPNLIQELHDAASSSGMRLNTVTPQAIVNDGPIDILPYKIALTGSHQEISAFARSVGKLSRIITLSEIQLKADSKDDKSNAFTLTAMANTYKAVDPNAQLNAQLEQDSGKANAKVKAKGKDKAESDGANKK